jgi:hypothetical protein
MKPLIITATAFTKNYKNAASPRGKKPLATTKEVVTFSTFEVAEENHFQAK